jgi:hypothetical protein
VSEIRTGVITLGTLHAGQKLNGKAALSHYENTGAAVADVAAGEDIHGIWISGALRPTVTEKEMRELRGAALSGDWRRINGNLELVAALAVNTPGFPVIRASAFVAEDGEQMSLVAAGALVAEVEEPAELLEEPEVEETVLEKAKSIFANSGYYPKRKKKQMSKDDLVRKIELAYDPDQERDENGRWGSSSGKLDGGSFPRVSASSSETKVNKSDIKPEADLRSRDLSGGDFFEGDLQGSNLRGSNATGANLTGSNLSDSDLRRVDFTDALLDGSNMTGADARNATMERADLREANMETANLHGANVRNADLRGASLADADLRSTDFTGSNLNGVDLTGASIDDNTIFRGAQLDGVIGYDPSPGYALSLLDKISLAFNPDQERDAGGRWASGGGDSSQDKSSGDKAAFGSKELQRSADLYVAKDLRSGDKETIAVADKIKAREKLLPEDVEVLRSRIAEVVGGMGSAQSGMSPGGEISVKGYAHYVSVALRNGIDVKNETYTNSSDVYKTAADEARSGGEAERAASAARDLEDDARRRAAGGNI